MQKKCYAYSFYRSCPKTVSRSRENGFGAIFSFSFFLPRCLAGTSSITCWPLYQVTSFAGWLNWLSCKWNVCVQPEKQSGLRCLAQWAHTFCDSQCKCTGDQRGRPVTLGIWNGPWLHWQTIVPNKTGRYFHAEQVHSPSPFCWHKSNAVGDIE